jgi:hypothetical protein
MQLYKLWLLLLYNSVRFSTWQEHRELLARYGSQLIGHQQQAPLLAAQEEEEESDMSPDDDDNSVASSHHSEATSIAALPMDLSLKVGVPTAAAPPAAEDLSPLSRLDAGGYFKHASPVVTEPTDDGSRKEPLADRNSNILRLRNDLEVRKESPMSPNRQDALDLTVSS